MIKIAGLLIAVVGVGIVAYGLYLNAKHPPEVRGMDTITVEDPKTRQVVTFRTRTLDAVGGFRREVELPNGTWIECKAGDCQQTLRAKHFELFETLRERGN